MAIFAGCGRHSVIICALFGFLIGDSLAGQTYDIPPGIGSAVRDGPDLRKSEKSVPLNKQSTLITLNVKDSPISYVIDEIIRQSAAKVILDRSHKDLNQRVDVNISDKSALEAINSSLVGTSLVARHAPDGKAIIIGVRKSSASKDTQSVSSQMPQEGEGVVSGVVIDSATGRPVSGVTVHLIGGNARAITDEKGAFTLHKISFGEATVSFRLLGYVSAQRVVRISAGSAPVLRVMLQAAATSLNEVVTTATGQQRRVEIPNDIAKVNADSLMQIAPVRSFTDLLAVARIPGVEVTPSSGLAGSPSRIRLRGVGSISQSNDPVVIVDGVWINSETSTAQVRNQGRAGSGRLSGMHSPDGRSLTVKNSFVASRLDDIDPASIETIEILRGPSAAALYGTDAANGIIVITTKRGQVGQTRTNVNVSHDWNSVPGKYQPVYTAYGVNLSTGAAWSCDLFGVIYGDCAQDSVVSTNSLNIPLLTDEARGRTTMYSMTVSGGTPALQYSLTGSFQNALDPIKLAEIMKIRMRRIGESVQTWLDRPDGRKMPSLSGRVTLQPHPGLDMAFSLQGSQSSQRSAAAGFNLPGGASNHLLDTTAFADRGARLGITRRNSRATSINAGITITWQPLSWMSPTGSAGMNRVFRRDDAEDKSAYCSATGCGLSTLDRALAQIDGTIYTFGVRTAIPVSLNQFDRFLSIRPSIGANLRKDLNESVSVIADSLALGSDDISSANRPLGARNDTRNSATGGVYVDLLIGIYQRWYTTLGLRRDVGSALSRQISAPTYPKLGTSWLISDEGFFPQSRIVTLLRLRGAMGHSAVQPQVEAVRGRYRVGQSVIGGQLVDNILFVDHGNLKLKPERAIEFEYGFDLGLFDERTQLNVTTALKKNRDQLIVRSIAPSVSSGYAGSPTYMENIARVYNRSVEVTLDHQLLERGMTKWDFHINFSSLLNRVDKLGDGILPFGLESSRIVEGYPLGGYWNRQVISYNDVDSDGLLRGEEIVISDSSRYTGWNHPQYTMAYGTTVSMLNGRLRMTANLAYDGNMTLQQGVYSGVGLYDLNAPLSEQAQAQISRLPAVGNRQTFSTLRFSSASISITAPMRWAQRIARTSSMYIDLQGSNLGLWTQYQGRDPGVNSIPVGESSADNGITTPSLRKYAIRIRLNY